MHAKIVLALALFALGADAHAPSVSAPEVAYPEGYRHWVHVKSALAAPKSATDQRAGLHHIYANALAVRGYETGRFPEGSVIAFDLLAVVTENGTTKESSRKLVDVMHKDSTRFAATGGWGFEEFRGDTRVRVLSEQARATCFACHAAGQGDDLVFSRYRP